MNVYYVCRHCKKYLATIPKHQEILEQLGLNQLTTIELQEIVMYDSLGNIHIHITCDYCEEAFRHNPLLHEIDFIIQ